MYRIVLVCVLFSAWSAGAAVVQDQALAAWSPARPPMAIGGSSEQKLAQVFTAGISGTLARVSLAINCNADSVGLITIEIQNVDTSGLPDGTVISSVSMPSSSVGEGVEMRDFPLTNPALVDGQQYAIVISAENSSQCSSLEAPVSFFSYGRGTAYFDARPNPPGWVLLDLEGLSSVADDLPFITWMHVSVPAEPRYCEFVDAQGVPNDWILNDVPICGCLSDPILSSNRCWFATPDWMLLRDMPFPWVQPQGRARWTLFPHSSGLTGLKATESDPLGKFVSETAVFRSRQSIKPIRARTRYSGVALSTQVDITYRKGNEEITLKFETLLDQGLPQQ